jgi:tRNA pseudouridine55 synthase
MSPGIHLLHKPVGPTSFSVVQACKSLCPNKSLCHGGTLDPFASGLLLILIEPATRLFDYLHAIPKTYEATIRWGTETDNGDPLGATTATGDATSLSPEIIEAALKPFIGWQEQTPPATSNKRIGGQRAYELAHSGQPVTLAPTRVYLHQAEWLSHDLPHQSRVRLTVRGGYYARSLVRDLGRALGCFAHLSQLHRTRIGPWLDPGRDHQIEIHGREILPWAPTRLLTDQEVGSLKKGGLIPIAPLLPPDWTVPLGFPDPQAPVRGFHREKLCFLLAPQQNTFRLLTPLRGGL